MKYRGFLLQGGVLFCFFFSSPAHCQGYAGHKIQDFYLSNYKEDGSRDWEVSGKEAIVCGEDVDIQKMKAKYYTCDDEIIINSDKAKLNQKEFNVFLKENVHIENKEGMRLLTDSLDWNRSNNKVQTSAWVKAQKDEMQIHAKGLDADTNFEKVDFEEEVEVTIPAKKGKFTTITCKGPLEIEYNDGKAVFHNDVVVEDPEGKLFADQAIVFFDMQQKRIIKIVADGNVRIVKDENVTFAEKATYIDQEAKIVLEGSPRVIYFPSGGKGASVP